MIYDLKIKILVVDDDQSIRKLCMTIGGSLGFLCQEADSAERCAGHGAGNGSSGPGA